MEIETIKNRIKGMQPKTRSELERIGTASGAKTADEFYLKLGKEFIMIYDSLSSIDVTEREVVAVNIFQARHLVKPSGSMQDVNNVYVLDIDAQRTSTSDQEPMQNACVMLPDMKKMFVLIAKGANRLAIFERMEKGYNYTLKDIQVQTRGSGTIWFTDTTVVENEKLSEITRDMLTGCFGKKSNIKDLPGLIEKAKRDTLITLSDLKVASVGSPTDGGAYHVCFDEQTVVDLAKDFPGLSVWIPSRFGTFGVGSEILVAKRVYIGKSQDIKASAIHVIPTIHVPYTGNAPAGALPSDAPVVVSAFEL